MPSVPGEPVSLDQPTIEQRVAPSVLAELVTDGIADNETFEREAPGRKKTEVPRDVRATLARLRIEGESVAEIMRQTELTKTIATRLARDVDEMLSRLRSGRY